MKANELEVGLTEVNTKVKLLMWILGGAAVLLLYSAGQLTQISEKVSVIEHIRTDLTTLEGRYNNHIEDCNKLKHTIKSTASEGKAVATYLQLPHKSTEEEI